MKNRQAILEQFLRDDIRFMFGNPGTVEEGFLDALSNVPDMRYVLTLQESVAVMIADGYARAAKKPALVQIHSTPGLGNAIGALYQAYRGHSPLVVIGGNAGVRYEAMDAQMAGDLVAMARPVTKWSAMVMDHRSVLRMLRRAIKIASTPPMGPVYLCLPQDVLDEEAVETPHPTSIPSCRVVPEEGDLRAMADELARAETPVILVGDGVAYSGAQDELTRVAELLGAEVWDADSGELNMSYAHPLYMGATGHMFGERSLPITSKGDVILICGTYMLPEVYPVLGDIYRADARVFHVDLNAYEIAKNHRVDLGVVSDPKVTLGRLGDMLEGMLTDAGRARAKARLEEYRAEKEARRAEAGEADEAAGGGDLLQFDEFASALARWLPDDAMIFDEALTNSPALVRYLTPRKSGAYFLTRGGSLGVGITGAIGMQLASPDKSVWGFTGDGGAMYTIQALWTAKRHNVPAKFVVCNNRTYRLLQLNIRAWWEEQGIAPHPYPLSFDLSEPDLRFHEMAAAMGVDGARVETPAQIEPAIERALTHEGPFLIDVVLEGDIRPDMVGVVCGQ